MGFFFRVFTISPYIVGPLSYHCMLHGCGWNYQVNCISYFFRHVIPSSASCISSSTIAELWFSLVVMFSSELITFNKIYSFNYPFMIFCRMALAMVYNTMQLSDETR